MNLKIKILLFICSKFCFCYSQIVEEQKNFKCDFYGDTTICLFDKNNDTSRVYSFTDGKLDGKFVDFVKGIKRLECCIVNGNLDGECITYDKKGRIHTITWFKDGCIMGGREFYSNGKLKSILLPGPEKNMFKGEIRYNKRGKESNRIINERPIVYYLWGNKYLNCTAN